MSLGLHAVIYAQATTGANPEMLLTVWGPLGIIVTVLIAWARTTITRERERNDKAEERERLRSDKAEAKLDELQKYLRDEFLPTQIRSQQQQERTSDLLTQAVQRLTEVQIRLQRYEELDRRRGDDRTR